MSINVTVNGNPVCCSKRNYLLSDPDVTKKNEFNRRRKLRIEQVRQQSKDLASHLRQEFRKEREKQINKFEQEQISELAKWQARKLLSLQEKYQECVSQVGTGHRQAAEEPDLGTILGEQRNRDLNAAKERGKAASERARKESEEAQAKASEVAERHKLKRTVEDLRSKMISSIGKSVRKTKTTNGPLQEIIVNVPNDERGTSIRTIRTISSDDQHETIVKTFYKARSPTKQKVTRKSPQRAAKNGTDSLTLDLRELNQSGTSFDRSDANESFQDASVRTDITRTKTTSNVPFQLPLVNVSEDDEERDSPKENQDGKGPTARRNRVDPRQDSHASTDGNRAMRDVGAEDGAARTTRQTSRAVTSSRAGASKKRPDPGQVHSARGRQASAKQGPSCYCPENPGPSESATDLTDPYCSQPRPHTVTPVAGSTDSSGASKVQMYDHSGRYHREYSAPDVVERMPRTETTTSSSEHMSHVALAARQAEAAAEALRAQEAIAKQRGQRAVNREAVRRDYAKLMGDLQTLSREERLARGSMPPGEDVHQSDVRRRERTGARQRHMDSAFEAVLHRSTLPGRDTTEIESTATVVRQSTSSRPRSPPLVPTQLNVGEVPAPAPRPKSPEPKFVFVIPYSPEFSDTSIVVGIQPRPADGTDGPEDTSTRRKRLDMGRESPRPRSRSPEDTSTRRKRLDMGRESPRPRSRSPEDTSTRRKRLDMGRESPRPRSRSSEGADAARKTPSPGRKSPEMSGRRSPVPSSPRSERKSKSPERPSSPEKSRRSPTGRDAESPGKGRAKSPRQAGQSSPGKSGRKSPAMAKSRTPSPESPSPSTMQDSSASLELISLEALMDRVHLQRTLLLEEVGRNVLAALPREAPFLQRSAETVADSSESSLGTVEYLETKVKQVWAESTPKPEPVRPASKSTAKRSRKKQRTEQIDTDTSAAVAISSPSLAEASSETTSFEGVQIVVSVRDKSPWRQARVDDEGQAQRSMVEEQDEPDRPAKAPSKKSPKKSPKPPPKSRRITEESTSTSYNSPPDRLDPRKTNVLSTLLQTIGQQQEKLEQWRSSINALKPTPSLEAYVDRLLNMGERSMEALSEVSHVSTPASSVVNDPANVADDLDSLLRDRVDDIAHELEGLQHSTEEEDLLRLLAEREERRAAEALEISETQRRPKEDVRRTSLGKRVVNMDEKPEPRVRLVDREKVCAERISNLAEQIERVRLERQIIVDSSGSSTRDSTRYESPPLEIKSPVLVPLSPRVALSLVSPQSNGNDDTRYVSPPPNVVSPSSLTTRLSPPPPGTPFPSDRSAAVPANPIHRDTRAANRHKPPASMWRSNARSVAGTARPHELSLIAEVDSPRPDVSEFPDIMAEMLRRRLISSPLHFSHANSTAVMESSVDERTGSNSSPAEDLSSELTRLGFGWASATLRKTRATQDLSLSSSPESFGRTPRRSGNTTTPAQTSRDHSGPTSPGQTSRTRPSPGQTSRERSTPGQNSRERSSLRSPPRTSRDRSTPVHGSDASRSPAMSFRGNSDISTVRGTGSEGGRS